MPISKKLQKFLESNKVKYEIMKHRTVYTAYDKAATLEVEERIVGKILAIKTGKDFALVLIPANKNLDKGKFKSTFAKAQASKKVAKIKNIEFATENWMKKNLKGVKPGAVPPFGNLWGLPTFIDKSLLNQTKIIVNGGDCNCSIKISPAHLKKIIPDLVIGTFTKKR